MRWQQGERTGAFTAALPAHDCMVQAGALSLQSQYPDTRGPSKMGDGNLTWGSVWRAQDWGSITMNVIVAIALIITTTVAKEPTNRYDALGRA